MVRGDSGWPVLFNTHWMVGAVQPLTIMLLY